MEVNRKYDTGNVKKCVSIGDVKTLETGVGVELMSFLVHSPLSPCTLGVNTWTTHG